MLIICSYPGGESYRNPVELFHSHLSKAMTGIVDLDCHPHGTPKNVGSDNDIVLKNHKSALQSLTNLFKKVEVNEMPVLATFEDPTLEKKEFCRVTGKDGKFLPKLEDVLKFIQEGHQQIDQNIRVAVESTIKLAYSSILDRGINITMLKNSGCFTEDDGKKFILPGPKLNIESNNYHSLKECLQMETKLKFDEERPSLTNCKPNYCNLCNLRLLSTTEAKEHQRLFHPTKRQAHNQQVA